MLALLLKSQRPALNCFMCFRWLNSLMNLKFLKFFSLKYYLSLSGILCATYTNHCYSSVFALNLQMYSRGKLPSFEIPQNSPVERMALVYVLPDVMLCAQVCCFHSPCVQPPEEPGMMNQTAALQLSAFMGFQVIVIQHLVPHCLQREVFKARAFKVKMWVSIGIGRCYIFTVDV